MPVPNETVPNLTLNDGTRIPQLGYGVFLIGQQETEEAVGTALAAGYRHIDTAAIYRNEEGVGAGIRASGVPRDRIWVTTKLWNSAQGYDSTLAACDESLRRLGLDHVDLYLIHWPTPARDLFLDSWRAMIRLRDEGKVRSIGVSNFRVADLEKLMAQSEVVPAINQIELHPLFQQAELRAFHARHGIATEAWGPLGQGKAAFPPALAAIAEKHGRTQAQVILRWHLQLGNVVIPKSVTPSRIRENIDVFDFTLDEADMATIAGFDRADGRGGPDPDTFTGL